MPQTRCPVSGTSLELGTSQTRSESDIRADDVIAPKGAHFSKFRSNRNAPTNLRLISLIVVQYSGSDNFLEEFQFFALIFGM